MKGLKCIVSLLLSITSLGLFVNYSDVNAARHNIVNIPLYSDTSFTAGGSGSFEHSYSTISNSDFYIDWYFNDSANVDFFADNYSSNEFLQDSEFEPILIPYFDVRYQNNHCEYGPNYHTTAGYSNYGHDHGTSGFHDYYYRIVSYFANVAGYSNIENIAVCMQTAPFGQLLGHGSPIDFRPEWDDSSLVNINVFDRYRFIGLPPYYYSNSSFDFNGTFESEGNTYNVALDFDEIFGKSPNKFSNLSIPFGHTDYSTIGHVYQGRSIVFDGAFQIDTDNFSWSNYFLENGHFWLSYSGLDDSENYYSQPSGHVDCSVRTRRVELPNGNPSTQIYYSCPFVSPVDFEDNYLYFALEIGFGSDNSSSLQNNASDVYIFDTGGAPIKFGSAFVVTDQDSTPGSDWGRPNTGNYIDDPNFNPGISTSADAQGAISSLSNLFNFSFINPFAPVFALFSSNSDGCRHIPVIAGMLHAEDDLYCPWFPSSVRTIVTPVIYFSSMMLLFGFAVRWLGSSSGNLFEDSSVDSGSPRSSASASHANSLHSRGTYPRSRK